MKIKSILSIIFSVIFALLCISFIFVDNYPFSKGDPSIIITLAIVVVVLEIISYFYVGKSK